MKVKGLFWILSVLLLLTLAILSWFVFKDSSRLLFFIVEGLILITLIYLFQFYQRIVKPLHTIGSGMELLKEQDFSSRLSRVGQTEADRIVDVFNKMMEQLKEERLRLREQNHFLDLMINASPMGVVILDLDRKLQSVNPSACKILGIKSAEEVEGKSLLETELPIAKELADIPLSYSKTLRLNDANIYKCTHSSFVDRGFQHPFYLIETLTREVFVAERKAYEKVIRMIAHEVNNTTAGIISTLDTIVDTFDDSSDMAEIKDVLNVSVDRCYSMSRFITTFADVVRIPEPEFGEVDLNNLLVSCTRFMERSCLEKNIRIISELNENQLKVKIDTTLFEQVLLNIIKNAAESIEENGTIYIRTATNPLSIEIADTGKGITKEVESKLFSPFFSTKPNGQGIGLIFIREVLLKHGCTFSLHTYADGLTRFRILLE
ncbi:ATP-binding protein [Massilibacteroides sp.]|uniref:sensor histidine kinase n=1 Tax=Massilibacteroides sp. TaxID=2034766 RepID=UPI002634F4BF|nr:ATP-binding protein [Massilibacteroides sp.]MDD4515195.1 ATP-binding protein [Massilibacteroides sp.]